MELLLNGSQSLWGDFKKKEKVLETVVMIAQHCEQN